MHIDLCIFIGKLDEEEEEEEKLNKKSTSPQADVVERPTLNSTPRRMFKI